MAINSGTKNAIEGTFLAAGKNLTGIPDFSLGCYLHADPVLWPGLNRLFIIPLKTNENVTECLSSEFPTQNRVSGQQNLGNHVQSLAHSYIV